MDPLALPLSLDARLLACLALVVRERASDLFLLAGAAPTIKRQGAFLPIAQQALSADDVRQMAYSIMREAQRQEFEATMECDLSLQTPEGERFRVNVHMQRGQVGIQNRICRQGLVEELEHGMEPQAEVAFVHRVFQLIGFFQPKLAQGKKAVGAAAQVFVSTGRQALHGQGVAVCLRWQGGLRRDAALVARLGARHRCAL